MLNNEQFLDLARQEPHKIQPKQRSEDFMEIYAEFNMEAAQAQADRCLHCASPYCQWACPVHNYIPNWLKLVAEGNIIGAVEMSHRTNSLPEMCGRICPQDRLCEGACTLEDTGFKAVTIGAVERFILEEAISMGWQPDLSDIATTGKKVSIVGAGPAGLACADVLLRNGITPIVYDKHPEAGGLLTFGIPEFKLEKQVVVRRRKLLEEMGCLFHFNVSIGEDIQMDKLLTESDAVFLAMGTYDSMSANLQGEALNGVENALPFLIDNVNFRHNFGIYQNHACEAPKLSVAGKRVVILGGGDTAMDCSRTSIRQGASEVNCVYRRDRKNMPGSPKEVTHAMEEGVNFEFNTAPLRIIDDGHGYVKGIEVISTYLSEADENGRRMPKSIEGSERVIACDVVLVAFGFRPNPPEWLNVNLKANQTVDCSEHQPFPFQTSHPQIFAGGDMVLGSSLVVQAVYEGRKAAEGIIDYLEV